MIHYKNKEEIELIRESALIVSRTLGILAEVIKPGISPKTLDKKAEEYIRDQGALPGFLDIISVDCGALKNNYYGDHAFTFAVGEISDDIKKLLRITKESLYLGIEQMVVGKRIGDIGYAVQHHAEKNRFGVVRQLVGHGLGKKMHEAPEVPNFGKRGSGHKIKEGLVLAIEPMINLGTKNVIQLADGWTIVTSDRKPSAHFEHNVAVVDGQPEILSTFQYIEEALVKQQASFI